MNTLHVKTGDTVIVLSGDDRGKKGKVLEVSVKEKKVIVQGVNIVKKHVKPKKANEQGGIVEVESPMYACKVALACPQTGKPIRKASRFVDGKKMRYSSKSGKTF
ncbi:MAG: 50S ribosomal protein L24 [Oscillospiraceae bacterium]|jgi:large subunit ribosomal protein L24|nr:50S ribosomal protein L24 [Oscillospiraceae bacterium]